MRISVRYTYRSETSPTLSTQYRLHLGLFELSSGLDQSCLALRELRFRPLKSRLGLCQCHLVVSKIWLGNGLFLFHQPFVVHQDLRSCFRNPPNQPLFAFAERFVVDFLVSALIRLESWSVVAFVERFQSDCKREESYVHHHGRIITAKSGLENYLVLAGAVRSAYQPWEGR